MHNAFNVFDHSSVVVRAIYNIFARACFAVREQL